MGVLMQNDSFVGGIDSSLVNKIGTAPLNTVAQDLSGAVNELKASGGGGITDVQVDGASVVTSGVAEIDLTPYAETADLAAVATSGSYNDLSNKPTIPDISGKVDKAGDTMTGSLTISNSLLGNCILKNNSYTINTSSNNGVSSFSGNNFEMQDSASTISTKFGNYLSSDGSVKAIISAHNKKTDGTAISNSLEIKIAKDGTKSYEVSDPAAFRSAIGAGYTIATGDNNGQIKVTPSSGSAYNVSVKGLGSAAYLTANTAASNSTVVQRNSSGYIYANYFNTTCGAANPSSYTNSRALFTSDDGFIRKSTAANFRTMIGAVNKAGDDMSGNLTISVSGEGQVSTKSTAWGLNTSSNNGLSQNASAGAFYHKDKNNNIVARTNCYGQSDGQTVLCIQSYNRTTSNAEVMTGLWIWSKKNGAHAYSVTDAAAFRTAIGAAASSSRAYKENIQNMTEEEAKKILNVNIYSYDYKDGFGENNHNKNQFGVIAEEVIEQIPYAVNIPDKYDEDEALKSSNDPSKGGRNLITIDYWKFVPHLIKTVQIQEKRINELEEEIKAIKEAII